MDKKNYRKGVGIIIVNSSGQFFLGKRIGAEAWQFPQGGIDDDEHEKICKNVIACPLYLLYGTTGTTGECYADTDCRDHQGRH